MEQSPGPHVRPHRHRCGLSAAASKDYGTGRGLESHVTEEKRHGDDQAAEANTSSGDTDGTCP